MQSVCVFFSQQQNQFNVNNGNVWILLCEGVFGCGDFIIAVKIIDVYEDTEKCKEEDRRLEP